jgi:glycosyltransferase involved in cell wall biosynthesis
MPPVVSVILPVYNSEKYIVQAINSILDQSFKDFELLVFDDASNDNTLTLMEQVKDERFRLVRKEKNTGYTQSLIKGVHMSAGKYIARMDSDDWSDPDRLRLQVEFLERNPEVGIVGTSAQTFSDKGEGALWTYPESDEDIRTFMLADSPFAHPSVMMRKSVLDAFQLNYDHTYEPCEDYKLWFELLKKTKGANLPGPLLKYRLHPEQTIQTRRDKLLEQSNRIRKQIFLHEFGVELNEPELGLHYAFFNQIRPSSLNRIEGFAVWRRRLLQFAHLTERREPIKRFIGRFWLLHLYTLTEYRPRTIKYLFDPYIFRHMPKRLMALFLVKSLCFYRIRS